MSDAGIDSSCMTVRLPELGKVFSIFSAVTDWNVWRRFSLKCCVRRNAQIMINNNVDNTWSAVTASSVAVFGGCLWVLIFPVSPDINLSFSSAFFIGVISMADVINLVTYVILITALISQQWALMSIWCTLYCETQNLAVWMTHAKGTASRSQAYVRLMLGQCRRQWPNINQT